jgi:hypothetical protein
MCFRILERVFFCYWAVRELGVEGAQMAKRLTVSRGTRDDEPGGVSLWSLVPRDKL